MFKKKKIRSIVIALRSNKKHLTGAYLRMTKMHTFLYCLLYNKNLFKRRSCTKLTYFSEMFFFFLI